MRFNNLSKKSRTEIKVQIVKYFEDQHEDPLWVYFVEEYRKADSMVENVVQNAVENGVRNADIYSEQYSDDEIIENCSASLRDFLKNRIEARMKDELKGKNL